MVLHERPDGRARRREPPASAHYARLGRAVDAARDLERAWQRRHCQQPVRRAAAVRFRSTSSIVRLAEDSGKTPIEIIRSSQFDPLRAKHAMTSLARLLQEAGSGACRADHFGSLRQRAASRCRVRFGVADRPRNSRCLLPQAADFPDRAGSVAAWRRSQPDGHRDAAAPGGGSTSTSNASGCASRSRASATRSSRPTSKDA